MNLRLCSWQQPKHELMLMWLVSQYLLLSATSAVKLTRWQSSIETVHSFVSTCHKSTLSHLPCPHNVFLSYHNRLITRDGLKLSSTIITITNLRVLIILENAYRMKTRDILTIRVHALWLELHSAQVQRQKKYIFVEPVNLLIYLFIENDRQDCQVWPNPFED